MRSPGPLSLYLSIGQSIVTGLKATTALSKFDRITRARQAAAIRGALRAEQPDLLTVVLPQSLTKQPPESQELIRQVANVQTMPENDDLPLEVASRRASIQQTGVGEWVKTGVSSEGQYRELKRTRRDLRGSSEHDRSS